MAWNLNRALFVMAIYFYAAASAQNFTSYNTCLVETKKRVLVYNDHCSNSENPKENIPRYDTQVYLWAALKTLPFYILSNTIPGYLSSYLNNNQETKNIALEATFSALGLASFGMVNFWGEHLVEQSEFKAIYEAEIMTFTDMLEQACDNYNQGELKKARGRLILLLQKALSKEAFELRIIQNRLKNRFRETCFAKNKAIRFDSKLLHSVKKRFIPKSLNESAQIQTRKDIYHSLIFCSFKN